MAASARLKRQVDSIISSLEGALDDVAEVERCAPAAAHALTRADRTRRPMITPGLVQESRAGVVRRRLVRHGGVRLALFDPHRLALCVRWLVPLTPDSRHSHDFGSCGVAVCIRKRPVAVRLPWRVRNSTGDGGRGGIDHGVPGGPRGYDQSAERGHRHLPPVRSRRLPGAVVLLSGPLSVVRHAGRPLAPAVRAVGLVARWLRDAPLPGAFLMRHLPPWERLHPSPAQPTSDRAGQHSRRPAPPRHAGAPPADAATRGGRRSAALTSRCPPRWGRVG